MTDAKTNSKNLKNRPPIVAVLGHVDHGKTTLLDYIRKTNVAAREAGGITQAIGAYEIEHNGKRITFIDTPGHEAFSKMRTRGAKIADLGILVVAADDSVKPQTKESIEILRTTQTPFIVAVNKIDKPGANIEKTKNDLMTNNVLLEGAGGNISWQAISAKTGQGVDELLDLILLAAEMENLDYDPESGVSGVILEAKADSRRGIVVSAIIKNGILKVGDRIATESACAKIKTLENFLGERAAELLPSSPALILGFEALPQIGEEFFAGETAAAIPPAGGMAAAPVVEKKIATADSAPRLNIILKADVAGSLEILSEIIKNLGDTNVVNESIGEITDGDIKNAIAKKAVVLGFKSKANKIAENLARNNDIKIISSEIIYELVETVKEELKLLAKPLPQGIFNVLKIFSQKNKEHLIGGRVKTGIFRVGQKVKILRADEEIGSAKILSIKKLKQEVKQVSLDEECGFMVECEITINEDDRLVN